VVVDCWGPGCNGSTRAAFTLATLGYTNVRELIGGFEYWARKGLAVGYATLTQDISTWEAELHGHRTFLPLAVAMMEAPISCGIA
jgi:3-mercaptopyruvate sulfurtransferase SseA